MQSISEEEERAVMKGMKTGKVAGSDCIPVQVQRCLRERAADFLTSLFNTVLESERMAEEWRSVLVLMCRAVGTTEE